MAPLPKIPSAPVVVDEEVSDDDPVTYSVAK